MREATIFEFLTRFDPLLDVDELSIRDAKLQTTPGLTEVAAAWEVPRITMGHNGSNTRVLAEGVPGGREAGGGHAPRRWRFGLVCCGVVVVVPLMLTARGERAKVQNEVLTRDTMPHRAFAYG